MQEHKDGMFHDGTKQFCKYNKDNDTYTMVLRTLAKDSVTNVYIYINDIEVPMEWKRRDDYFSYYEASIAGKEFIRYYFRTVKDNQVLFYSPQGATEYFPDNCYFQLKPGFFTPDWAKGAVMYQIMTDRFYNGDQTNDVEDNEYAYIGKGVSNVKNWNEYPAADGTRQFYGGDLKGVIDKLDYLSKLGVEVIYFNPLFVSPSNHKYDIQDYDYIDPHFGKIVNDGGELLNNGSIDNSRATKYKIRTTDKENLKASNELFVELVDKAHKKGIKVILDGVFNHCGSFNKWMDKENLYKNNNEYTPGAYQIKDSKYNSFFKFDSDMWPNNSSYEGWWGFDTLPKLNYEGSEELCNYVLSIGKKWVSPPYNADGWRLDVAADLGHSEEFNHNFWKRFRNAVKEANPNAIILAEHYGNATNWLKGDQWDTIMNYDGFMDPVTWFLTGIDKHSDNARMDLKGDASAFNRTMKYSFSSMQYESILTAMNELSNHDHSRFLTRTNKMIGRVSTLGSVSANENVDEGIFKQGVVMQMTLPGAPTIYYGDEAGVCGWTDPDNRRTYPWGKENLELLEFYREAICIHKQNKVFKTGSYKELLEEKNLLVYGRFDDDNAAVVIINTGNNERDVDIPVWQLGTSNGAVFKKLIETSKEFYNCGQTEIIQEYKYIKVTVKGNSSKIYLS